MMVPDLASFELARLRSLSVRYNCVSIPDSTREDRDPKIMKRPSEVS